MINAILNIIAFIIAIAVAILVIVSIVRNDERGGCDFNCEDCPFPKCSEAEIRRMKNDIHNR